MKDTLQQYRDLREALRREKAQLENRLREISMALGDTPGLLSSSQSGSQGAPRGRGRRGGGTGGRSLKDLVLEVTSGRALTKQEILDEVQRKGYKFESKNPANSLGVILYGKKPKFSNEGGRFQFTGSMPARAEGRKRTMSPEARARIRAAALARWQKAKASGKKRL